MECSNANCSNTGNGRMVSCWLCMNFYHLTCSGLKARDADALADPQKFLQWTCPDCRKVNIEFYKLFKDSKDEFNKINKDLLELQKKFLQFGELFGKYQNLEKFVNTQQCTSPKPKRDGLRSAMTRNVSPSPLPDDNPNNSDILMPSYDLQPLNSKNNSTSSSTNLMLSTLPPPCTAQSSSISNTASKSQLAASSRDTVLNVADNNSTENTPKPLRVIPPSRNIFISRLASETTKMDVEFYIKSKIGTNCNLSIYKYSYSQPRTIASFKITVPDEFFEKILNPNFWPVSTYVREYVFSERRRNAVRLPTPQNSKN